MAPPENGILCLPSLVTNVLRSWATPSPYLRQNRLESFIFKVSFTLKGKPTYGDRPAPFHLSQETCSKHLLCAGQDELVTTQSSRSRGSWGPGEDTHTLWAQNTWCVPGTRNMPGAGEGPLRAAEVCPPPPPYLSSVPFCMINPRTSIAPLKCPQDQPCLGKLALEQQRLY